MKFSGYRIVMIGPNGERDYVEKLLDQGCPCICGGASEYAGVFHYDCAKRTAENLRENWLTPHVRVEVEPVA